MKLYAMPKLQQRRALVEGRWIIGIDPAKVRHDAVVIGPYRLPVGRSFSFAHNLNGFNSHLWKRLEDRVPHFAGAGRRALAERLVFAIETSCNLWVNLADWLFEQGFCVVPVSPLSTHHARTARAGDFSQACPIRQATPTGVRCTPAGDRFGYGRRVKCVHPGKPRPHRILKSAKLSETRR